VVDYYYRNFYISTTNYYFFNLVFSSLTFFFFIITSSSSFFNASKQQTSQQSKHFSKYSLTYFCFYFFLVFFPIHRVQESYSPVPDLPRIPIRALFAALRRKKLSFFCTQPSRKCQSRVTIAPLSFVSAAPPTRIPCLV
jgi:magnesium-transporting ATPase (P-type)